MGSEGGDCGDGVEGEVEKVARQGLTPRPAFDFHPGDDLALDVRWAGSGRLWGGVVGQGPQFSQQGSPRLGLYSRGDNL